LFGTQERKKERKKEIKKERKKERKNERKNERKKEIMKERKVSRIEFPTSQSVDSENERGMKRFHHPKGLIMRMNGE